MRFSSLHSSNSSGNDATYWQQKLARDGNNFNFLRLVLAALVLFSHSFALTGRGHLEPLIRLSGTLSLGALAVDGFFLLSGFLIVRSWTQAPHVWPYLKKRMLRIYPAFLVAFAFCLFVVGPLASSSPAYFGQLHFKNLVLRALLLQEPAAPAVFEGQLYPVLNGALWTIAYEFRCYLLVIILGWLGAIKHKYLWLAATLLLMTIYPLRPEMGDFGFAHSFYILGRPGPLIRLSMVFMVGGCFFLFLERLRFHAATALGCLPLIVAALSSQFAEVAVAALGGYVLLWFAFAKIPFLDRFKRGADVSYGLYLYGWPIQKLLLLLWPTISPLPLFAFALILSYVCGYLSWQIIEKPALALKRRSARDPRLVSA